YYMIVRFCLEVFYWMIQACLLFYVLYRMNHGEIRLFLGLACLLGFTMYVVLCKSWYEKVLEVMITIVKTISSWTLHCINILILQPVMWLLHMLFSLVQFIRSEEHMSELQSRFDLVCRLLTEENTQVIGLVWPLGSIGVP